MSSTDPHQSSDSDDPERLLRRGLRATSSDFEARFNDMRRRLAREAPMHSGWISIFGAIRRFRLAAGAVAAAALAVIVFVRWVRNDPADFPVADPEAWYVDTLRLDESLRAGMALADAEARDAITWISTDSKGEGS